MMMLKYAMMVFLKKKNPLHLQKKKNGHPSFKIFDVAFFSLLLLIKISP